MHRDWPAFVRAVCEDPLNDAPRLIAADWLEERDDPLGEFIRTQIELATEKHGSCAEDYAIDQMNEKALRERERELLLKHGNAWVPKQLRLKEYEWLGTTYRKLLRDDGSHTVEESLTRPQCTFNRGFVDSIKCRHDDWVGTACERCGNRPIGRIGHSSGPLGKCRTCHGLGRVNAHGIEIVRQQPVTLVRFTDREPWAANGLGGWYWFTERLHQAPRATEGLAYCLLNSMTPDGEDGISSRRFDSPEAAHAASSDAAVSLARAKAGLPAIAFPY